MAERLALELGATVSELFGEPNACACGRCGGEPTFSRYRESHASAAGLAGKPQSLGARDDGRALRDARVAKGLSQHALAKRAQVTQAAVGRLEEESGRVLPATAERIATVLEKPIEELLTAEEPTKGVGERTRPATTSDKRHSADELSLLEAVRRSTIPKESLREAIESGRLQARFGRRARTAGRLGTRSYWLIRPTDLDAFVASLPTCRYPGCKRPGSGPTGCCSGPHAQGVLMAGKSRPGVGAKISAARKGRTFGPHTPKRRAHIATGLRRFWNSMASDAERERRAHRMSTPQQQFVAEMGRWGCKSVAAARRAARKLEAALVRRRGGAPQKAALHARWLDMFEGRDVELEELLAADGLTRLRAVAFLDWQRHPDDWPREKWPASRCDPEDLDPKLIRGAEDRVRKGLQSARKKLRVR